jgi:uncharacterized protein YcbX
MSRFSKLACLCVVSLTPVVVWAQSFSGRITGMVSDSTRAVIPGVSVSIRNDETGARRHVVTDTHGRYVAPRTSSDPQLYGSR